MADISSEGSHDFRLENLQKFFEECLQEDGKLNTDSYIQGYEEVYKFLNLLGTVFGWVASDVLAKIEVVKNHRKGSAGDKYITIDSMLDHEVSAGVINRKAKDSNTGARNLLRLHRALHYINTFLEALPKMQNEEKCCPVSQNAYKSTLAPFHPWVVQKAALMAMHMLPTKEGLIQKICGESKDEFEKAQETLPKAVKAMNIVYEKTQELYKAHKLLDLP